MILLAIDTAAGLCAASVHDTQAGELGRAVLDIGKGHAERLMAVIDDALGKAELALADLDAVAVSIGPGSFTGVRVGVATARGLALALKIPAVGVGTLEALAEEARARDPGKPVIARIEAGRGQAYVAGFLADGAPAFAPAALDLDDAAALIGEASPDTIVATSGTGTADIATYATLAARKLAADPAPPRPRPLYLRDADAKPQTAFALPRKGGR